MVTVSETHMPHATSNLSYAESAVPSGPPGLSTRQPAASIRPGAGGNGLPQGGGDALFIASPEKPPKIPKKDG